jgi:hypothetical protein
MDDTLCRRFFLQPTVPPQRQYEALRAVFVETLPQNDVARHFGYSYAALRQLVHQFRTACAAGVPPPFSSRRGQGDRPRKPRSAPSTIRKPRRLPTRKH